MESGIGIESGNFCFMGSVLPGAIIIDVREFGDGRGSFLETYRKEDFAAGGICCDFVQDNQSSSGRGVLRGLHFQVAHPQSKLVRVVEGSVFDVAVDLRPESETFGKWEGVLLSAENHRQFFIPRGFAHGFLVVSDRAVFCYKCDDVYHPNDEGGLMWNDPEIGIEWPLEENGLTVSDILLSEKDRVHPLLNEYCAARG